MKDNVKDKLKLRVVGIANDRDAKELPCGTLVVKGYSIYLVGKNNELIPVLTEDDIKKGEDKSMPKDFLEEHFVKSAEKCSSPEDILNWYRNLYYKEDKNTEHRIVAEAINEFFVKKLPELLKEAKTEAIKEFAERLKNKIKTECNPYGAPTFDYDTSIKILNFIDNLVKEMVGDKE